VDSSSDNDGAYKKSSKKLKHRSEIVCVFCGVIMDMVCICTYMCIHILYIYTHVSYVYTYVYIQIHKYFNKYVCKIYN
jgi:hypothetical protein